MHATLSEYLIARKVIQVLKIRMIGPPKNEGILTGLLVIATRHILGYTFKF